MLSLFLTAALAGPLGPDEDGPLPAPPPLAPRASCDLEYPFDLVPLPRSDFWVEFRADRAWGSATMIGALEHAANRLALHHPDAPPLLVGDIARQHGGHLPPHRTHGDGRSADLGLFGWTGTVGDLRGGFPKISPDQLDVERTWTVIDALLDTGDIEHILLDQRHIDRLRTHLAESGRMSGAEIDRIFPSRDSPRLWSMTSIVRHAEDHADHLHVRVLCGAPPPFSGS